MQYLQAIVRRAFNQPLSLLAAKRWNYRVISKRKWLLAAVIGKYPLILSALAYPEVV